MNVAVVMVELESIHVLLVMLSLFLNHLTGVENDGKLHILSWTFLKASSPLALVVFVLFSSREFFSEPQT